MSSSNLVGCWEGQIFDIGLAGLEAVVEAAEEAVEEVTLRGGVSIAGHTPSVVLGPGTRLRGANAAKVHSKPTAARRWFFTLRWEHEAELLADSHV